MAISKPLLERDRHVPMYPKMGRNTELPIFLMIYLIIRFYSPKYSTSILYGTYQIKSYIYIIVGLI